MAAALLMNIKLLAQISFIGVTLALRVGPAPTAGLSYVALAIYALMGRAYAIQALALSWFFTMLNPGIGPEEVPLASVGRYLILATAAISVALRVRRKRPDQGIEIDRTTAITAFLGLFLILNSLIVSPIKDVSLLKALTWIVAFLTLISAWSGLPIKERLQLERQLFGGLIILMLVSLPLLASPLGYLRTEYGFQGALNHPQAFGPTMAFLAAWLVSRILGDFASSWRLIAYSVAALALIVLSGARTAGLGLMLSLGLAIAFGRGFGRRKWLEILPGLRSPAIRLMLLAAFLVAIGSGPFIAGSISSYLTKGTDHSTLADAYEGSRGFLIDRMWDNIQQRPFEGVGFGIASDPETMDVLRDPIFGLPTGAAVEKGVAYIAILEELGIFGLVTVLIWMWTLLRRAYRSGRLAALAICLTAFVMNIGESTLFAPGGMGMLSLILIAWAATEASSRNKSNAKS